MDSCKIVNYKENVSMNFVVKISEDVLIKSDLLGTMSWLSLSETVLSIKIE